MMRELARPCIKITSERVSDRPLRRNPLVSLFGGKAAEPLLGVTESKFGGIPYCDPDEGWDDARFIGQIDLEEATALLPPHVPRLKGLLRLDAREQLTARWFPEIDRERAVAARPRSYGDFEAKLRFELGWTIPEGNALDMLWPQPDAWYEYDAFFPAGYNDETAESHRLLGHRSSGLDYEDEVADCDFLLRLDFDGPARFHWGSTCQIRGRTARRLAERRPEPRSLLHRQLLGRQRELPQPHPEIRVRRRAPRAHPPQRGPLPSRVPLRQILRPTNASEQRREVAADLDAIPVRPTHLVQIRRYVERPPVCDPVPKRDRVLNLVRERAVGPPTVGMRRTAAREHLADGRRQVATVGPLHAQQVDRETALLQLISRANRFSPDRTNYFETERSLRRPPIRRERAIGESPGTM